MRTHLRRLLVGIVILLIGVVGALVGRNMWQQHQQDLAQKGLEYLPGVSQHIQDFRRVKIQEGRKVWEVAAQDARYFDDESLVVVRQAVLQWFLKDGRRIGLKGDEGRITLDGREVSRVAISGAVEVSLADYVVHAEQAEYDHARQLISTPGAVEILGDALHLTGKSMEVDVAAQRVTFRHGVWMQVQPARLRRDGGSHAPL